MHSEENVHQDGKDTEDAKPATNDSSEGQDETGQDERTAKDEEAEGREHANGNDAGTVPLAGMPIDDEHADDPGDERTDERAAEPYRRPARPLLQFRVHPIIVGQDLAPLSTIEFVASTWILLNKNAAVQGFTNLVLET